MTLGGFTAICAIRRPGPLTALCLCSVPGPLVPSSFCSVLGSSGQVSTLLPDSWAHEALWPLLLLCAQSLAVVDGLGRFAEEWKRAHCFMLTQACLPWETRFLVGQRLLGSCLDLQRQHGCSTAHTYHEAECHCGERSVRRRRGGRKGAC